jgi:hypothetical protein
VTQIPLDNVVPGQRIRLTMTRGLTRESEIVEIHNPPTFVGTVLEVSTGWLQLRHDDESVRTIMHGGGWVEILPEKEGE